MNPALAAQAAANMSDDEWARQPITERIEHPQADGNLVAQLYSGYTRRRVIVSSAAAQVMISFVQEPPLTNGEAAELLKKAALLEGLVFVPAGDGIDKLVSATGGTNPKNVGVDLYLDVNELPEGDAVVSYVMMLEYIKPDEAVRTFTQVIGQFGTYGSIAAVPNASAIVITENTQLIRMLVELKDQIDVPSAQVATRFVKVEHADVTELAETLNEILNTQQQAQRSAGVQRSGQPTAPQLPPGLPNPAAAASGDGGSAGEETPVQIVAEPRTNRIFIMGRPIDLIFVEGLIKEFDTATDQRNYLRRKLKFLAVSDFLPIASDALERTQGASSTTGGAGGGAVSGGRSSGGSSRTSRSSSRTQQTSTRGGTSFGTGGSRDSSSIGGGGGTGVGNVLNEPDVSTAPESLLIGRTLLVADNISNSIVVQGPPQSLEVIKTLLDELDVKAEQVMISTVFGQLSLNDDSSIGFDWLNTVQTNGNKAIAGSSGIPPLTQAIGGVPIDPRDLISPDLMPTNAGLSVYGQLTENLFGYLRALESTGRFNVLSRPTIFTTNNQRGTISSGQRIAVPTNSYQGGINTGISTNIEYRDVVLSLEVIPLVNSADEVTLTIALLNDDIVGEQEIEGVGRVPTIGTRELVTTVTVPDGSTVVLGGLITVSDRDSVTGIPILSSIPGIGKLFSTTTKVEDRQELLIFIQPQIVNDERSMAHSNNDLTSRYDIAPDVLDLGGSSGVLPPRDTVRPAKAPAKGSSRKSAPPAAIPVDEDDGSPRRVSGSPNATFRRRR